MLKKCILSEKVRANLYKIRKLKVKLWWVGARKRKKRAFFVAFILPEGNFFNICVLSQWILHWIHFQNIHTFAYQKHYFIRLFFKSSKAFSVSLNWWILRKCPCINFSNYHLALLLKRCTRIGNVPYIGVLETFFDRIWTFYLVLQNITSESFYIENLTNYLKVDWLKDFVGY